MYPINQCYTVRSALPRSQAPLLRENENVSISFSFFRTQSHGQHTSHVDEDAMGRDGFDIVLYLHIRSDWDAAVRRGVT